jgi:CO/xanthine dehydrogenase FAD-binding subunit
MVNHFLPTSKQEALEILSKHNVDIIAGGTDLMVQRRTWANTPPKFEHTMNIMHIKDLQKIEVIKGELHIGSTVSLTDVYNHSSTPELMKRAIYDIASPALRNLATIAGNIGNASPAGDTLPILYALNARVVLESSTKRREVPIEDVIVGPRKTTIQTNELITTIILPLEDFDTLSFVKVGGRKADAISKVSFTGAAKREDNMIKDIRICFGAVAPVIVRNKDIERRLIGLPVSEINEQLTDIIEAYKPWIRPIDDQRSNKDYRTIVAINLLTDFLQTL